MSDHRFEQRGLLHVQVQVARREVHVIVLHLGLMPPAGCARSSSWAALHRREVPPDAPVLVAGDFNDWGAKLDAPMREIGLNRAQAPGGRRHATFPSRVPLFSLDRIYTRGLNCVSMQVRAARPGRRMSSPAAGGEWKLTWRARRWS
jgi:endonuclease/exonuclease/phosphatase family metal-dependent hydrolase